MGFTEAVRTCLGKYVGFSGRATRAEYWWFVLFAFLAVFALSIVDSLIFGTEESAPKVLAPLFQLAMFLPLLAAGWRRLHDTGRPGWYLLVPTLLSVLFVLALLSGIFAFGALEAAGASEDELRGPAALLGVTGMLVAGAVQLILSIMMLWWLTRPTDPSTNSYGPPPQ